ncbi:MAG: hypothetical protein J3K34DRAFT_129977 [Monoraphidium minutum]|nr:MAG: hypothetical protein J3K34DRAFT_129977 [Monoraphidium minutum]
MFKKPVHTSQSHLVSGADRKKLRRALEKQLGPAADEALLDALLPPKAGDLQQAKLNPPARGLVYILDGAPILFDASAKGDLYVPTAMGLWRAPGLLPRVLLKHPSVSHFVCGYGHGRGADVMLPGVDVGALPHFEKGALVAVAVPGNPAPIAVGLAAFSSGDMAAAGGGHGRGKAVEVLQAYGDHLWADVAGKPAANEGFLDGGVAPLPGMWDGGSDGGEGGGGEAAAAAPGGEAEAGGGEPEASGSGAAAAAAAAAEAEAAAVDMEALLEAALLQALHKSVKPADLPLAGSALWSQHMLPNRPPGSTLDVKKSKHKKISKLLQVYAKAGLLSGKEDKAGDFIISGVNRSHHLYDEFRPYRPQPPGGGASSGDGAEGGGGGAGGGGGEAGGGGEGELLIAEVFKPTRELKAIFEAVGASPDALYSGPEASEVALAYVKAAKLEEGAPDGRSLLLDAALCDGLFKGLVKKGELYPTTLPKAVLREKFIARMQAQVRSAKALPW